MLCGHLAIGAIEVDDQSRSRIRAPISPPPSRKLLLDRVLRLTLAAFERSRTVCLRSVAFVRRRFAGDRGDLAMIHPHLRVDFRMTAAARPCTPPLNSSTNVARGVRTVPPLRRIVLPVQGSPLSPPRSGRKRKSSPERVAAAASSTALLLVTRFPHSSYGCIDFIRAAIPVRPRRHYHHWLVGGTGSRPCQVGVPSMSLQGNIAMAHERPCAGGHAISPPAKTAPNCSSRILVVWSAPAPGRPLARGASSRR